MTTHRIAQLIIVALASVTGFMALIIMVAGKPGSFIGCLIAIYGYMSLWYIQKSKIEPELEKPVELTADLPFEQWKEDQERREATAKAQAQTKWFVKKSWLAAGLVILGFFGFLGGLTTYTSPETPLTEQVLPSTDADNSSPVDQEAIDQQAANQAAEEEAARIAAEKAIADEAARVEAERVAKEAADAQAAAEQAARDAAIPQEDPNLPFKAICKDGTVSYQDNAAGQNYQGMCSNHDGVATKLGRVA